MIVEEGERRVERERGREGSVQQMSWPTTASLERECVNADEVFFYSHPMASTVP